MHFCIHFCHPWKHLANSSSSWKVFSFLVTALLIYLKTKNKFLSPQFSAWERAKSHRVLDLGNMGGGQELWFLSWSIVASHWSHCVQVHCYFLHPKFIHFLHPGPDHPPQFSALIPCWGQVLPQSLILNLQSFCINCFTLAMLSPVFDVEGRPDLRSSSTFLHLFLTRLCHSKICVLDITFLPQTSSRSFKHSVGLFFSFTKKIHIDSLFYFCGSPICVATNSTVCEQARHQATKF